MKSRRLNQHVASEHHLDERAPTRAEQRALDRLKRRENKEKRSERLKEKRQESILDGFVAQYERRQRSGWGIGD